MTATSTLQFYLNGKSVTIENPSPSTLLVDYLRSPEVRLTGTKKPCGQGGCGGCTVILSDWPGGGSIRHRAINSCLRRLCSLNGMAITTIEGTGSMPASLAAYPAHHPTASRGGPDFQDSLPTSLVEAIKQVKASNKGISHLPLVLISLKSILLPMHFQATMAANAAIAVLAL